MSNNYTGEGTEMIGYVPIGKPFRLGRLACAVYEDMVVVDGDEYAFDEYGDVERVELHGEGGFEWPLSWSGLVSVGGVGLAGVGLVTRNRKRVVVGSGLFAAGFVNGVRRGKVKIVSLLFGDGERVFFMLEESNVRRLVECLENAKMDSVSVVDS